jgi:hypothetical protein
MASVLLLELHQTRRLRALNNMKKLDALLSEMPMFILHSHDAFFAWSNHNHGIFNGLMTWQPFRKLAISHWQHKNRISASPP